MNLPLPKISVIMPVLNGEKTIRRALQSVAAQNYPNTELIILDGKSTDNTLNVINEFKDHIAYLESSRDGNPTVAVNKGLKIATGDLIVTFMCDDFYEKGTFDAIAKAFQHHPEMDIYTCGGRLLEESDITKAYKIISTHASKEVLELNFHNICFANSAICCRFIKKSLFDKIGVFLENIPDGRVSHANDKEFLLRAVILGAKNHTIDFVGHNYVSHPGSFTFSGNRKMTVKLYVEHRYFVSQLFKQHNLTHQQIKALDQWYYHQSARLAFYLLATRQFSAAKMVIKEDLPKYHLEWLASFIFAPIDFAWRRATRKIKGFFTKCEYLYADA